MYLRELHSSSVNGIRFLGLSLFVRSWLSSYLNELGSSICRFVLRWYYLRPLYRSERVDRSTDIKKEPETTLKLFPVNALLLPFLPPSPLFPFSLPYPIFLPSSFFIRPFLYPLSFSFSLPYTSSTSLLTKLSRGLVNKSFSYFFSLVLSHYLTVLLLMVSVPLSVFLYTSVCFSINGEPTSPFPYTSCRKQVVGEPLLSVRRSL